VSPQQSEGIRAPKAEDIAARKKLRLEEHLPISSHGTAARLPTADSDQVDPDSQGTRATGQWTLEEDAELNCAVTSNRKKKNGKEYRTDWVAVAALVPGICHGHQHIGFEPCCWAYGASDEEHRASSSERFVAPIQIVEG
jgi:hypothetical protein